jgi:photosystem II stability/assembly factor-like uncharacterized protein
MSERILVATRKGLFTVARGAGGRWAISRREFLGDHLSLCHVDRRSDTLFAAFDHGHFGTKLWRSRDGGESWAECGQPAYPPRPEDADDTSPMSGRPVPWSVLRLWALASGHDDEPGTLWLGTIPGGLFKSLDGGDSWELVRSLWDHPRRKEWFGGGTDWPGLHSICVDPRDGRQVLVGISCGGVWRTTDGGQSWALAADGMRAAYMPPDKALEPNIQDPHAMARCAEQPEHLWVQHHNGIFRSTDGARSWQEIERAGPSTFGFAVVCHPRDGDTAWFVPAVKDEQRIPADGRVVVTRTRDGGRSFDVLTNGLPQQDAWDLTFRHALDIDPTGDRLVFGTTTGSLWVSEDQGDSWQTVSEHLPPVDCVRFA